eukprot:CAMPEP_0172457624 /NCGR_PEP_ID=MMETSP1065-20121228/23147_1 /TAXON_ID=265537 /ORGANISM="Amphiprora paludosa, Strain CCMP125" /LENGTH=96 /DNA_ID=CAMNT_0013211467 /DNA_START=25 /DNA_END=312 /DNA_ORIENTATION=+
MLARATATRASQFSSASFVSFQRSHRRCSWKIAPFQHEVRGPAYPWRRSLSELASIDSGNPGDDDESTTNSIEQELERLQHEINSLNGGQPLNAQS